MVNSRRRGQDYEREVANDLKQSGIFPNATRNWHEQTAVSGVDLANTEPFDFEIKGGKAATLKTVLKWLKQVEDEGRDGNWKCVVVRPFRKEKHVIIPWGDFMEILNELKAKDVI